MQFQVGMQSQQRRVLLGNEQPYQERHGNNFSTTEDIVQPDSLRFSFSFCGPIHLNLPHKPHVTARARIVMYIILFPAM
jgi:hypothetical protein